LLQICYRHLSHERTIPLQLQASCDHTSCLHCNWSSKSYEKLLQPSRFDHYLIITFPWLLTVQRITGLPHTVCLKPVSTNRLTRPAVGPTYLIPKTLVQKQLASRSGNQPARFYAVSSSALRAATSISTGNQTDITSG